MRGALVKLCLGRRDVEAFAEAVLDEAEVAKHLVLYLKGIPLSARMLGSASLMANQIPRDWQTRRGVGY